MLSNVFAIRALSTAHSAERFDRDLRSINDVLSTAGEQLIEPWTGKTYRDPELSRLPYEEYLISIHWRELRDLKLLRAGGQCQSRPCKFECMLADDEEPQLHVHHLTYERLGREWESDLIVLCRHCHAEAHGKVARP